MRRGNVEPGREYDSDGLDQDQGLAPEAEAEIAGEKDDADLTHDMSFSLAALSHNTLYNITA